MVKPMQGHSCWILFKLAYLELMLTIKIAINEQCDEHRTTFLEPDFITGAEILLAGQRYGLVGPFNASLVSFWTL